jgi:maltose O-acetyltransferase
MIAALIKHRYRPSRGSKLWLKYWAKRLYLFPQLLFSAWRGRRFVRRCQSFGAMSVVSPSKIGGDWQRLSIGDHCAIGRVEIQIHADVTIGDCVVVSDGCRLLTGSHNVHSPSWELVATPIVIKDYAWVATGATLLPGVTIGRGAVVGAGAIVSRSVEDYTIVAGNPARPVGERRVRQFQYFPSHSAAVFEAWLGPPSSGHETLPETATRPLETGAEYVCSNGSA